ncbi:hypothetical protein EHS25_005376 [Saitozyma podzolica]|uniref:Phytanoyl-CoA dioxygenase n=1 Tax=Saitozyma podzolica TaxID=1890683 RepID=A0A427XY63_9TREE|nr:hypothetical protein EHS25_005376 [Saitozyma podzolica]
MPIATPIVGRSLPVETNRGSWDLKQLQLEGNEGGPDPSLFAGPGTVTFNTSVQANEYLRLSTEAGRMDFIENFVHDEDLPRMVKRIKKDWSEPFLFKRQLLRSNIPKSERSSTKVHYDQVFLRGAGPISLTAWVPIGDISPRSGGLLYLEDSVSLGLEIEDTFTEMNKNLTAEERLSAFNVNRVMDVAGDVVFHHPCMIHCSARNLDPDDRIRLATDLRFADKHHPYDARWANNYFFPNDGL